MPISFFLFSFSVAALPTKRHHPRRRHAQHHLAHHPPHRRDQRPYRYAPSLKFFESVIAIRLPLTRESAFYPSRRRCDCAYNFLGSAGKEPNPPTSYSLHSSSLVGWLIAPRHVRCPSVRIFVCPIKSASDWKSNPPPEPPSLASCNCPYAYLSCGSLTSSPGIRTA